MPIGWFIAPYKRLLVGVRGPTRYCAMDDFTTLIWADGGDWTETEILGNRAVVKVRASSTTLTAINAAVGFTRLPKDALDIALSDLTNGQKQALRDEALDQGYTLSEIQDRFPNDLGSYTLGEVLRFMATRRRKPRYDQPSDTIILDGPVQGCRLVDDVDSGVR